ncbi:xylose isomerase-like protein [Paraphysoderma sedebokerense]|nr:xylose isomerase-like protein [Paraphysoderma sedebokerense]
MPAHWVLSKTVPTLSKLVLPRYIGAHVSAAKGVENSVLNCAGIGGTAFSLFLKPSRTWAAGKPYTEENISLFKQYCQEHGIDTSKHIVPHGSYLINLGNPDEEKREKSFVAFMHELERCETLDIGHYNFHPGSTTGECTSLMSTAYISDCINRAHKATSKVTVVVENMAGQGNVIGSTFEELKQIIDGVDDKSRIGVCLDSCHLFAAGYDISTYEGYHKTMAQFDDVVGFKYLKAWHLNDSKCALGSKKDRHANIGRGFIGLNFFENLLADERFKEIPMILETPPRRPLESVTSIKTDDQEDDAGCSCESDSSNDEGAAGKKKRGRPRKKPLNGKKQAKGVEDFTVWAEEIQLLLSFTKDAGNEAEEKKVIRG